MFYNAYKTALFYCAKERFRMFGIFPTGSMFGSFVCHSMWGRCVVLRRKLGTHNLLAVAPKGRGAADVCIIALCRSDFTVRPQVPRFKLNRSYNGKKRRVIHIGLPMH